MQRLKRTKSTYGISVFHKHLVEFTYGDDVDDTLHVVEAMDPLTTLGALTTHVKHSVIVDKVIGKRVFLMELTL